MSALAVLGAVALLLGTGAGIGCLLRELAAPRGVRAPLGGSATMLLGLFALAAALPNLFALGVARPYALGLAQVGAVAGLALALRRHRLRWPSGSEVAVGVLFALLLEAPFALAATRPLLDNDALLIWWPKVQEVAAGSWPDLHAVSPQHQTPFYPRGMAWLASLAGGAPDEHVVRALPVAFAGLAAAVMVAVMRTMGHARLGIGLAALFLLLPDVARQCHLGMSDLPIAAAVLCVGLGLAHRREHAEGALLAITAALGAAAIKEEGAVVLLVVTGVFVLDLLRRPWLARRAAAAVAASAILLPFARLRAAVPQTRLDALDVVLAQPDVLVCRSAAVAACFLRMLVAPSTLGLEREADYAQPPSTALWGVAVCLLLLVPRRWPRPVPALPAVALLAVALATQVFSTVDVRWHARTTLPRLALEMLPLLLVAAASRCCSSGRTDGLDRGDR